LRYAISNGFAVPDPVFTQTEYVFVCLAVMLGLLVLVSVAAALRFVLHSIVLGAHLAGEIWVAGWILERIGLPLPKELKRK